MLERAREILNFAVTFVTSVKLIMYKAFTSDKGVTKVTLTCENSGLFPKIFVAKKLCVSLFEVSSFGR